VSGLRTGLAKPRAIPQTGQVHMLICTLDYEGTGHELSCHYDGDHMAEIARACGVTSLTHMRDKECTKKNVLDALHKVASSCRTGADTFVTFFAGHGMEVKDTDGDEDDGKDESYVMMSETGQLDWKDLNNLLTDDEFTATILSATAECPEKPQILCLSDCCHSGTMCDFDKNTWRGYKACSISGCKDAQTSGDTSSAQGGICTSAMCLAVESFNKQGNTAYSVNDLFKRLCKFDDDVYASEQDVTLHSASDMRPSSMAWPLIPRGTYTSPYTRENGPPDVTFAVGIQSQAAPAASRVSYVQPTSYAQPAPAMPHIGAMPQVGQYYAPTSGYGTRGLGGPVGGQVHYMSQSPAASGQVQYMSQSPAVSGQVQYMSQSPAVSGQVQYMSQSPAMTYGSTVGSSPIRYGAQLASAQQGQVRYS